MSEENSTSTELQAIVDDHPDDHTTRGRLIGALLAEGDPKRAWINVSILVEALPEEEWVLTLATKVALAIGDHLHATHYRRRLRALTPSEDPTGHTDHPSGDSPFPRLRLLPGGGEKVDTFHIGSASHRRLDDIAGLETVKRNLEEIITATRSRSGRSEEWIGGVLLYGPPGCGKAFCAEVVAGELEATMWTFDLAHAWQPRTLLDASRRALDTDAPVLIYLDNIDVGSERQRVGVLRQLLPHLDATAKRDGPPVIIMAAATFPWLTTTEVVRPGRLERVLLLLPPDRPSRKLYLHDRLTTRALVDEADIEWLAAHTDGYSFEDLDALIDMALDEARGDVATHMSPIHMSHEALRHSRRRVPPSSADWLNTAGHHALMNETGGLYDDLLKYFRMRQRH